MFRAKDIQKYVELTGEIAKLHAKIHNTYVVYNDSTGQMVREYPDGTIEKLSPSGEKIDE